MNCTYCNKILSTIYSLKRHQETSKFCILKNGNNNSTRLFTCEFCNKTFTAIHNLQYHISICKKSPGYVSIQEKHKLQKEKKQLEKQKIEEEKEKQITILIQQTLTLEETVQKQKKRMEFDLQQQRRIIEDDMELKLDDLSFQMKQNIEEHNYEVKRLYEEKIIKQEEKVKQLEDEVKRLKDAQLIPYPTSVHNSSNNKTISTTNNDSFNNNNFHISITNYLTEERVTKAFESYDVSTLLGSQKELANFTVDHFLLGKGTPIYLCTDSSRKKFSFRDEQGKIVEDKNCTTLITNIMKYGIDKINDICNSSLENVPKGATKDILTKKYESIKTVKQNGSEYQSQLGKRLPSTVDEKSRMDDIHDKEIELPTVDIEESEEEEIEQLSEEEQYARDALQCYLLNTHIGSIPLYKLNRYRTLYKEKGISENPPIIETESKNNPEVIEQFQRFIRKDIKDRTIYNKNEIVYVQY